MGSIVKDQIDDFKKGKHMSSAGHYGDFSSSSKLDNTPKPPL